MIYYKKKSWIKKIFKKNNDKKNVVTSFFAIFKKIISFSLSFFFIALTVSYLLFIYYAPKFTSEEKVENYINNYLAKNSALTLDIENLKIKPNIKLQLNIRADKLNIKNKNENVLILDFINLDVNLASLFFKKIDLDKIEINNLFLYTKYTKDKNYDILNYFNFDNLQKQQTIFKLRNFNLFIKKSNISLFDLNTNKNFDIKTQKINILTSLDETVTKNSKLSFEGKIYADNLPLSDFILSCNYKIKQGKIEPKNISVDFNSNNLDLSKIQGLLAFAIKITNQKINIKDYILTGFINGKVKLKSDFKKLSSSGKLSLNDVKIINKPYKIELNNINSIIDFNDNQIQINNLVAYYEKNKIILNGYINNFANLDLKIHTEKISFKKLLDLINSSAFIKNKIDTNDFYKLEGFANFECFVKGAFVAPDIICYIKISDFVSILKQNNISFASNEIKTKITKNEIHSSGKIKYHSSKNGTILNPELSFKTIIKPEKNNLNINSFDIFSNNTLLAQINGQLINKNKNFEFKNFKINLKDKLNISLTTPQKVNFTFFGDIFLTGDIKNPCITTNAQIFNIQDFNLPLNIKQANLNIENNNFYFSTTNGKYLNEVFEATAQGEIKNYLSEIKSIYINAPYLNLDNINNSNKKMQMPNCNNIKVQIGIVETMGTILNSVIFDAKILDNILYLDNFKANAFDGDITGDIKYYLSNNKLATDLILKNLNTRLLINQIKELKEYSIALSGKMNTLLKAEFYPGSFDTILKTFNGYIKFNIDNGELNQLAKLERFLQAGNILSQSILKLTLNSTISAISKQNTGDFKTIEGTVKIKDGVSNIQYIKTQGSNMSLYITGNYNLLTYFANLKILGKIPSTIVNVMGDFGKFSAQKLVDNLEKDTRDIITSLGASPVEKLLSVELSEDELLKIPQLSNETSTTIDRKFIVRILGDIKKTSSIKLFRWHSN